MCLYHAKISSFMSLFTSRNKCQFLSVFFSISRDDQVNPFRFSLSGVCYCDGEPSLHSWDKSSLSVIWIIFLKWSCLSLSCTIVIECRGLRSLWGETRELKVKQLTSDSGLAVLFTQRQKDQKGKRGREKTNEGDWIQSFQDNSTNPLLKVDPYWDSLPAILRWELHNSQWMLLKENSQAIVDVEFAG